MNAFDENFPNLLGNLTDFEQTRLAEPGEDGLIEAALVPLRDMVVFPNMVTPLFVGRSRSLEAISAAQQKHETIICSAQIDAEIEEPASTDIHRVGVETAVGRILRMPDGTSSVLIQGRRRVEIVEYIMTEPYFRVKARVIREQAVASSEIEEIGRASCR